MGRLNFVNEVQSLGLVVQSLFYFSHRFILYATKSVTKTYKYYVINDGNFIVYEEYMGPAIYNIQTKVYIILDHMIQ